MKVKSSKSTSSKSTSTMCGGNSAATARMTLQRIASDIDSAAKTTADFVEGKYHIPREDAEEITMNSIQYALRPALSGAKPWPKDKHMLAGMAINIAKLRAIDYIRHQKRHPAAISIDDPSLGPEDEEIEEHYALVEAAIERWREDQCKSERHELGSYAYDHLPEMFEEGRVSARDQDVFTTIYLDSGSVLAMAERYGIMPGTVYEIVWRVKQVLQEVGPRYLAAA